ncbi:hypothetical protein K431DRAFT_287768 [Polychaeton citri CBS 116435]|uniref:Protein EFR3 n=1 Tax=Polychaeton citri CBS 116435 TaxID=1314669 RepID=A0A9P4UJR3_9PEZI|nr:hypothetical protein K431DRAFT_287768 [Polychaeton citri CBS 116435]
MEAIRQKTRPKHQLLILKCYPRLPKNAAEDAKPNSSELSYLLFYASTRRSKLQKVGPFLEKKTASDLYKQRSANVTVTLQILEALLKEKAIGESSGFALIAPHVLNIIKSILSESGDVSLIETSVELWQSFCERHDESSLTVDLDYRKLYEQTVVQWAHLAHKDRTKKLGKSTQAVATQDSLRLREAGLKALRALFSAEHLSTEAGRQMTVTVPAVISNVQGANAAFLVHLQHQSNRKVAEEKRKVSVAATRPSFATVRTDTGSMENDPRIAQGTASDADDFMEGVVATLGLDCLKAVFSPDQRGQVRSATSAVLQYLSDRINIRGQRSRPGTAEEKAAKLGEDGWASQLFEMITAWTPVQNRFIVLVTLTETLVRLPLTKEGELPQHILLATMLDETLRSDLNMIGLSVMDILLSLLRHVVRVLSFQPMGREQEPETSTPANSNAGFAKPPTALQKTLLSKLQACISDLAIHVYYTDQISDMATAILNRLRYTATVSGPVNPATISNGVRPSSVAMEDAKSGTSTPSRGRSATQGQPSGFSLDSAKIIALQSVRGIIVMANQPRVQEPGLEEGTGRTSMSEGRTRTPAAVWANTEHLADDSTPSGVRTAYHDALLTWAKLEVGKADWTLEDCLLAIRAATAPALQSAKSLSRKSRRSPSNAALASGNLDGNHRRFLRVADVSPGRDSTNGRSASSSAAARVPRVEDLKRILNNDGPFITHAGWSPKSATRNSGGDDANEDTASESMMDVGDVDLGSETSGIEQHKVGSRKDVKALLASIRLDEDKQRPRTARMVAPPY